MRKKTYHLLAVLTALLAGAALSGAALAAGGAPERAVVRFDRQADPDALTAALEALEGVEVLWTYAAAPSSVIFITSPIFFIHASITSSPSFAT